MRPAGGGESVNLRDGSHHLGAVRCEAGCTGEVRPVEVFFHSETEPQKTGLKICRLIDLIRKPVWSNTHDANQHSEHRDD